MDKLQFKDPDRAAYTANRLFEFLSVLRHYAGEEAPADLDQARDKLAEIAQVTKNMMLNIQDTHSHMMVGGIPAEAFENDGGGSPGFLLPAYAGRDHRPALSAP